MFSTFTFPSPSLPMLTLPKPLAFPISGKCSTPYLPLGQALKPSTISEQGPPSPPPPWACTLKLPLPGRNWGLQMTQGMSLDDSEGWPTLWESWKGGYWGDQVSTFFPCLQVEVLTTSLHQKHSSPHQDIYKSPTDEYTVDGVHRMNQGEPCFPHLPLRLFDPSNPFPKAYTCSPGVLYILEHTPSIALASGGCGRQW